MSKKMKRELAEVDKSLSTVSKIAEENPGVDLGFLLFAFQKQRLALVETIGRNKQDGRLRKGRN